MSSKEIADIAGVRHDNAMRVCKDLLDKNVTPQIEESTFNHNGNVYPCYILNKRDSYVLMARLSPEFTGKLVDRWQELEAKSNALETDVEVKFNMASKLAKLCMDALNLPQSGQLKLMADLGKQFGVPTQFLPSYGIDAPPKSIVTTGSSVPTVSLTTLLKPYEMSAKAANQVLIAQGIVEERTRPSTKTGTKTFKALTDKGLRYGKNITSPSNPREVQIHWYADKVDDLLELLGL